MSARNASSTPFTSTVLTTTMLLVALAVPIGAQEGVAVEAALGTGVEASMIVGETQEFPVDVGRVFLWTRVTGAADSSIQHVWIHGDAEFPVTLQIGGSPWRTWSSKTIPPEWAGEWRVEIRDAAGNLLDTRSFMVGA